MSNEILWLEYIYIQKREGGEGAYRIIISNSGG